MRFLAAKNFPGAAVKALEALGHDVVPPPHANHYCVVARAGGRKSLALAKHRKIVAVIERVHAGCRISPITLQLHSIAGGGAGRA